MKLKDFDFRVWNKDEETLTYASKDWKLSIGFCNPQQDNGEVESVLHAYYDGEPMCPSDCEIELWSGIYDKKGERIYEGDIIKISPKEAYIKQRLKENPFYLKGATLLVEFHIKDTFGFWGNEEKIGKALHPLDFWHKLYHYKEFGEDFEIEILGNIHENADLLNARILKDKE